METKRMTRIYDDSFNVGDIISFTLESGEEAEVMAMKAEKDGMVFAFCDCIAEAKPMRRGDFSLPEWLNEELVNKMPAEIKDKLVPFEDGSLMRLMSEMEVFGERIFSSENEVDEQYEPMKNRKNRVAGYGKNGIEGEYAGWWLRSVCGGTYFCLVTGDGIAGTGNAS